MNSGRAEEGTKDADLRRERRPRSISHTPFNHHSLGGKSKSRRPARANIFGRLATALDRRDTRVEISFGESAYRDSLVARRCPRGLHGNAARAARPETGLSLQL